jgi:hypothetical protein
VAIAMGHKLSFAISEAATLSSAPASLSNRVLPGGWSFEAQRGAFHTIAGIGSRRAVHPAVEKLTRRRTGKQLTFQRRHMSPGFGGE